MKLTNEQGRELLKLQGKKKPVTKWQQPKLSGSQQQAEGIRLDIKPLSVNAAWQGKRFKTPAYSSYEKSVLDLLPEMQIPEPPYRLSFVFGFSNKASDLDNPVKMIQDLLSKKYGFNDKLITELHIKKELVSKGAEFIQFEIKTAA
jgi:Holliday junction resolvase RusA-like endonuclease